MFIERSKIWHRAIFDATKTIIDNLRQPKQEILPKLYWLAKYHNSFCKKYHCDEFIIPQEIITKMQRLVKRSVR